MKPTARLDYERLADALIDRGLLDREAAQLVLQQAHTAGNPFCEILVSENLVTDWEVARVTAEIFSLPFLPVEVAPPNERLLVGLDKDYLRKHGLVPIERVGDVITVAMPGMVPTAILNAMSPEEGTLVLPVVGLVVSNRAWLTRFAANVETVRPSLPVIDETDTDWGNIFDAGDEAVQLKLDEDQQPAKPGQRPRRIRIDEGDF